MIKLRRIESHIQQSAYRVDKSTTLSPNIINSFIYQLTSWKESIPEGQPLQDTEVYSFDGYIYYMIYYHKTLRLLLFPYLTTFNPDSNFLLKCAEACGGVCRTYKTLHRATSVGFSLIALYSVFLSGLTLVYCIWLSPKEVYSITTSDDLNSCSIVLYVITERWPGARKYRDAFESIKQCVLDLISSSDQPRRPLSNLDPDLRATLEDVQKLHPEGRADFSKMMSDMVGGTKQGNGVQLIPFQNQFSDYGNLRSDAEASAFRFVQQTGIGQFYGTENGIANDSGESGIMPLGGIEYLDGFDLEDFMAQPNQFGDPMI